jgi:predicted dehydrogenase
VSFDKVYETTALLIPYQIPLLIEKPAGNSVLELKNLIELTRIHQTTVQIGLNRRHYSVFNKAVEDAGGIDNITSIQVNWSETPKRLLSEKHYSVEQVSKILYGNSIHGLDMLTHFAGEINPENVLTLTKGRPFRWLMSVQGISANNKLASFFSTWDNPAPWEMIMTAQSKRYIFAPLESCIVKEEGQNEIRKILPDEVDEKYKPGFWGQAQCFMSLIKNPKKDHPHNLESALPSMILAEGFFNKFLEYGSPV